ncbi:MAG: NAD-dependent epimerase/dehydratase family protein [Adhaeribacter sp.]
MMHTILGAGGPISNALAKELLQNGETVRLVSRRPVQTSGHATWVKADLKDYRQVLAAVTGSDVLYLCAGLRYDSQVWAREWPLIMQNVIDVAKATGARLIFFDNVYMYGPVAGAMTEESPYQPSSKKGEIRARIASQLMDEVRAGNLQATIARAADFYGSESANSFFDAMVLQKYAQGSKAMWLGNPDSLHSFTYVADAARAVYLLGQHPEAGNQVWHLPTAPALRGREFLQLAAGAYEREPKFMQVNKLMLQALGLFTKAIGETAELYYQYQHDYVFSSVKFEKAFGLLPTSYADGVKAVSQSLFKPAKAA